MRLIPRPHASAIHTPKRPPLALVGRYPARVNNLAATNGAGVNRFRRVDIYVRMPRDPRPQFPIYGPQFLNVPHVVMQHGRKRGGFAIVTVAP